MNPATGLERRNDTPRVCLYFMFLLQAWGVPYCEKYGPAVGANEMNGIFVLISE